MRKHAKLRAAVIGCGAISDIYLTNLKTRFSTVEVVCCCALHPEHASAKAAQYGIESRTYQQILEDDSIQLILLLTPASTHYALIREALLAGKHVYTEKTMSTSLEEAEELLALARRNGLYLGSAPDTFLGAVLQDARCAIDSGAIGQVTGFCVYANRNLDALASKYLFLRLPGGGICFDYGVYYLTALVSLLGSVSQVSAFTGNRAEVRRNCLPDSPDYGQPYSYPNESFVTAALTLANGVSGTFALNGDSTGPDQAVFVIYGTEGILKLGSPDHFGDPSQLLRPDPQTPPTLQCTPLGTGLPFSDNSRGLGAAELADAVLRAAPCRCDASFAYHVLEVIVRIMQSGSERQPVPVQSSCPRPEPLSPAHIARFTAADCSV